MDTSDQNLKLDRKENEEIGKGRPKASSISYQTNIAAFFLKRGKKNNAITSIEKPIVTSIL